MREEDYDPDKGTRSALGPNEFIFVPEKATKPLTPTDIVSRIQPRAGQPYTVDPVAPEENPAPAIAPQEAPQMPPGLPKKDNAPPPDAMAEFNLRIKINEAYERGFEAGLKEAKKVARKKAAKKRKPAVSKDPFLQS